MKTLFRVKICGIKRDEDADQSLTSGADAIGLNFFEGSKRCVSIAQAQAIAIRPGLMRVGVFVNHSASMIREIAESCQLDLIQLHGDEQPTMVRELADLPILRVIRIRSGDSVSSVLASSNEWLSSEIGVQGILLDAQVGQAYGGTGHTLNWQTAADVVSQLECPVILAGGLVPANVKQAIREVGPAGVDVASGVESSPGIKAAEAIEEFVTQAKQGFASDRCS